MQSAVPMQEPGDAGNARSSLPGGKTCLQTFLKCIWFCSDLVGVDDPSVY
jgi:hypothetical protein